MIIGEENDESDKHLEARDHSLTNHFEFYIGRLEFFSSNSKMLKYSIVHTHQHVVRRS